MNLEFTFDIFMCVAILVEHRECILKTEGAIELLSFINGCVCMYICMLYVCMVHMFESLRIVCFDYCIQ